MLLVCTGCDRYTMQATCSACGKPARDPRPPKFSPEDKYGVYRRRLKRMAGAASKEDRAGGSP